MDNDSAQSAENDVLLDLRARLTQANAALLDMKHQTARITGKAEGVRLALSYVEEALRIRPGTCWCDGPDCGQIPCIEERGSTRVIAPSRTDA